MGVKMSKRLLEIAEMVDPNAYIADIGADHGYLPIHLVLSKKISWAQAVENKMGPYLNLKRNVDASGCSSHITVSLSDGISSLNGGVDTLILAGMGGRLSIDILAAHPENLSSIRTIILDPHRDLMKVRSYVTSLGFHIAKEKMILEDRIYYSIIKFSRPGVVRPYNDDELRFGPCIMEEPTPVFHSYLLEQKKAVNKILNGPIDKEKRAKYLEIYRAIAFQIARCESFSDNK